MLSYLFLSQYALSATPSEYSYSKTCTSITVTPFMIKANCRNAKGISQKTKLHNWKQCTSDIANIDGVLRCEEDYRLQERHNSDSFLQTCVSVTYSGQSIDAICQKVNGSWVQSQLLDVNTCSGDIANIDGSLHCKRIISEDK
jgi:hypothetical protein